MAKEITIPGYEPLIKNSVFTRPSNLGNGNLEDILRIRTFKVPEFGEVVDEIQFYADQMMTQEGLQIPREFFPAIGTLVRLSPESVEEIANCSDEMLDKLGDGYNSFYVPHYKNNLIILGGTLERDLVKTSMKLTPGERKEFYDGLVEEHTSNDWSGVVAILEDGRLINDYELESFLELEVLASGVLAVNTSPALYDSSKEQILEVSRAMPKEGPIGNFPDFSKRILGTYMFQTLEEIRRGDVGNGSGLMGLLESLSGGIGFGEVSHEDDLGPNGIDNYSDN